MKASINQDTLDAIHLLMRDKFVYVVTKYRESAHEYIDEIAAGIEKSDYEHIARYAHSLKSPSAMVGCTGMSEMAEGIEEKARSEGMAAREDIVKLFKDMQEEMRAVEGFFAAEMEKLKD